MAETIARRNLRMHRLFAASIESSLARILSQPLSPTDADTVRSYMLCAGFMSIEATDNGLRRSQSDQYAMGCLSHMRDAVNRYSGEVTTQVISLLPPGSPGPEEYSNLLAWEEALIESGKLP
jgi:hypothetical protein